MTIDLSRGANALMVFRMRVDTAFVRAMGLVIGCVGVLGCTPESALPPMDPRCEPLCDVQPSHFDFASRGIETVCEDDFAQTCEQTCFEDVAGRSEACADCLFERAWSTYEVYPREPQCVTDPMTFEDSCTFYGPDDGSCSFMFTSAEGYAAGVDQCIAQLYGAGPAIAQCNAAVARDEFCDDVCD